MINYPDFRTHYFVVQEQNKNETNQPRDTLSCILHAFELRPNTEREVLHNAFSKSTIPVFFPFLGGDLTIAVKLP